MVIGDNGQVTEAAAELVEVAREREHENVITRNHKMAELTV